MAKAHSWPTTGTPHIDAPIPTGGESSLTGAEPPVKVKPTECIYCFATKIETQFIYDAYHCYCPKCGKEWQERVREGDMI